MIPNGDPGGGWPAKLPASTGIAVEYFLTFAFLRVILEGVLTEPKKFKVARAGHLSTPSGSTPECRLYSRNDLILTN